MDIGRAFTFVTEDERWLTKLAIGALVFLLAFLIIPVPLLIGWQVAITRHVMKGVERPLPEWDNLGAYFIDGLNLTIAYLVYSLPVWLLLCIGFGATFLPVVAGANEDIGAALAGVTLISWIVLACLATLFALFLGVVAPAIAIQYVRTNELGALFRFGEVIAIARQNLANIVIAALAIFVANIAIQLVATVLSFTLCGPFVVAIAGSVWLLAAQGHLHGQIGANTASKAATIYA